MKKVSNKVLLLIVLCMGVGFSYLTSGLVIKGNTEVSGNSWDIYFQNIQVLEGSVSSPLPTIDTNKTKVNFAVELVKPGDYYSFTVDAVNNGTIDAMIDSIIKSNFDENVSKLFDYTVTYLDESEIKKNDLLESKSTTTYKVIIQYKKDISPSDLSSSDIDLNLSFEANYVMANDDINRISYGQVWEYDYSGEMETFQVPYDGEYKIELWGAQGGTGATSTTTYYGGKGSYTTGTITLKENTNLYVYVGGAGTNHGWNTSALSNGGWNGGGAGGDDTSSSSDSDSGGGGGGATDISIIPEEVVYDSTKKMYTRSQASYASRIMVAAGGGGGNWNTVNPGRGANGGGLSVTGYNIYHGTNAYALTKGTQTEGFAFGYAESGSLMQYGDAKGGGGAGYWTGVSPRTGGQGAGGTSYISGHTGCVAITSSSDLTSRVGSNENTCVTGTVDSKCSEHYSEYVFKDTKMIDGSGYEWTTTSSSSVVNMPNITGTGTETGHSGNGYAKITYIGNDNIYLTNFKKSIGSVNVNNIKLNAKTGEISFETSLSNTEEYAEFSFYINNETNNNYYISNIKKNNYDSNKIEYEVTYEDGETVSKKDFISANSINKINVKIRTLNSSTSLTNEKFLLTINLNEIKLNGSYNRVYWNYDYKGTEEVLTVPFTGKYKLEVWGAQGGGTSSIPGGYGGYSIGTIELTNNQILYINVGGAGTTTSGSASQLAKGGYNGGGSGFNYTDSGRYAGSGGGATHIAKVSGKLSSLEGYKGEYSESDGTYLSPKILIVAGGGGGYWYFSNQYKSNTVGSGGGYIGGTGTSTHQTVTGGTQKSTGSSNTKHTLGSFGQGGNGTTNQTPGGGGGFYGGVAGGEFVGSGGSGYIGNTDLQNKAMYCYKCSTSNAESTKTISTTNISSNPISQYAKIGNGYAKITYLGEE